MRGRIWRMRHRFEMSFYYGSFDHLKKEIKSMSTDKLERLIRFFSNDVFKAYTERRKLNIICEERIGRIDHMGD